MVAEVAGLLVVLGLLARRRKRAAAELPAHPETTIDSHLDGVRLEFDRAWARWAEVLRELELHGQVPPKGLLLGAAELGPELVMLELKLAPERLQLPEPERPELAMP